MDESEESNSMDFEITRIRRIYEDRDRRLPRNDWVTNIYHPRHPLGQILHKHNQLTLVKTLNHLGMDLESLKILDVGCGYGYWLRYFVELGAKPENLTGTDLSEERIISARQMNPAIHWISNEDETLPFSSDSFGLVMQAVVFSSILNEALRKFLANEMFRVTEVGGQIFWIDHRRSFADTLAGFSKSKVLEYFPGCSLVYAQLVHPRYFRFLYKHAWLAHAIYNFTKIKCDSLFLVLEKERASEHKI